jgi:hypothetical protein
MPQRILPAALTAALLALILAPVASQAGDIASRIATALRLARHADATARLALARAPVPGSSGVDGRDGSNGRDGLPGVQGPSGLSVKGDVGPMGPAGGDGAPGVPAPSTFHAVSASNDSAGVFVDASTTTVVRLPVPLGAAGQVLMVADAQLTGELVADGVVCELRFDGALPADVFQPVAAGDQRSLSLSAVASGASGSHEATLGCRKGVLASSVEVPMGRGHLSVVSGA